MAARGTPYTECKLYVDGFPTLAVGQYLRTPAGSAYLVTEIRQHRTRPARRNLRCLRWPEAEIPAGAVAHTLYWYPRKKKRSRTLQELT